MCGNWAYCQGSVLLSPCLCKLQTDAGKESKQKNFSAALEEKIFCALADESQGAF